MSTISCTPVGHISSPYKQKFAIPRQANLVPEAEGEVVFVPEHANPLSLRGIEQFSHLWLVFIFHETAGQGWSPLVHPPRLGGRERMGVFASRATHRPNPIGISVVKNLGLREDRQGLRLKVGGLDLLDGTPIVDIKPYLPWADAIVDAAGGYAAGVPESPWQVRFTVAAENQITGLTGQYPRLKPFILKVLSQDPRPSHRRHQGDDKEYGMNLYDLNIRWRVAADTFEVISVEKVSPAQAS